MSEEREPEPGSDSSELATLAWTVRLWKDNPGRLGVIALTALVAAVAGLLALGHPLGALIGFAMIAFSTADYWMPVHFRLDHKEARRQLGPSVSSIAWTDVRQVREDEVGAKLSPLPNPESRLEPFRGIYLRFSGNRDEVMERIRKEVGEECKISGPKN